MCLATCPVCRFSDCPGCVRPAQELRAVGDVFFGIAQVCGDLKLAALAFCACLDCGELHDATDDRHALRELVSDVARDGWILALDGAAPANDTTGRPLPPAPAVTRPAALALYTVAA